MEIDPIDNTQTEIIQLSAKLDQSPQIKLSKYGRAIKVSNAPIKRPQIQRIKKEEFDYDKNDWLCSVCGQMEAADGSDLLLCDGPCLRSFHYECLGLTADVEKMKEDWFCEECTAGKHKCIVCNEVGVDNLEVRKCSTKTCGLYFHYGCLVSRFTSYSVINRRLKLEENTTINKKNENVTTAVANQDSEVASNDVIGTPKIKNEKNSEKVSNEENISSSETSRMATRGATKKSKIDITNSNDDNENEETEKETKKRAVSHSPSGSKRSRKSLSVEEKAALLVDDSGCIDGAFSFRCPRHFCDTCYKVYKSSISGAELIKCCRCPRSYHESCIPPGSRYNDLILLCPHHPDEILPSKDYIDLDNPCACECLRQFWDQMSMPNDVPTMEAGGWNFLLPQRFRHDVDTSLDMTPPLFKMIFRLDYDFLKNKEEKVTQLKHDTDSVCVCIDGCDENCLNRILKIECNDSICGMSCGGKIPANSDCGNRQFFYKDYVKVQPFREPGRGWGARSLEKVPRGTLIMEYVGEVIDDTEMERRMQDQQKNHPSDRDFYIMELDKGFYVDGKHKGSLSRFINHSCDPNCELIRWIVNKRTRIGIFAKKDVEENDPLSYDYQFDTQEAESFKCQCGAVNCRGTMAPTKLGGNNRESLSKSDREKLIATGKSREKKSDEGRIQEEWTRSYTGKLLPGDGLEEIKNGPVKACFPECRKTRILLCRNLRNGSDFERRKKLLSEGKR